MTDPSTKVDPDALRALESAATPAPWTADTIVRGDCVVWGPDGQFVANIQSEPHWVPNADGSQRQVMFDVDRRDAELIAAVRNQLPALLADHARLTAELATERAEMQQRGEAVAAAIALNTRLTRELEQARQQLAAAVLSPTVQAEETAQEFLSPLGQRFPYPHASHRCTPKCREERAYWDQFGIKTKADVYRYHKATAAPVVAEATQAEPDWLVWSNEQRAWWGPGGRRYVADPAEAGRFGKAGADYACGVRTWVQGKIPPEVAIHCPPASVLANPDAVAVLNQLVLTETRRRMLARTVVLPQESQPRPLVELDHGDCQHAGCDMPATGWGVCGDHLDLERDAAPDGVPAAAPAVRPTYGTCGGSGDETVPNPNDLGSVSVHGDDQHVTTGKPCKTCGGTGNAAPAAAADRPVA